MCIISYNCFESRPDGGQIAFFLIYFFSVSLKRLELSSGISIRSKKTEEQRNGGLDLYILKILFMIDWAVIILLLCNSALYCRQCEIHMTLMNLNKNIAAKMKLLECPSMFDGRIAMTGIDLDIKWFGSTAKSNTQTDRQWMLNTYKKVSASQAAQGTENWVVKIMSWSIMHDINVSEAKVTNEFSHIHFTIFDHINLPEAKAYF